MTMQQLHDTLVTNPTKSAYTRLLTQTLLLTVASLATSEPTFGWTPWW